MEYIMKSKLDETSKIVHVDKDKLSTYEILYQDLIPCNIKERNNEFYLTTDKEFSSLALREKFTESTNFGDCLELKLEKKQINGYKNFGSLEIDGEKAYWVCKASGSEDPKLPSKLDYFRISQAEYEKKTLLTINAEESFVISMTVQTAGNKHREEEKVKYAMLGEEPPSSKTSLEELLGIAKEKEEEKEEEKESKNKFALATINKSNAGFSLAKTKDYYDEYGDYEDDDGDEEKGRGNIFGFLDNIDDSLKKKLMFCGIGIAILFVVLVIASSVLSSVAPNESMADLKQYFEVEKEDDVIIVLNGKISKTKGLYLDNTIYVPFEYAHDYMNKRLYYDAVEDVMFLSTSDAIIEMHRGSKTATIDGGTKNFDNPLYQATNDGRVWVNVKFLSEYSAFKYEQLHSPHLIAITNYTEDTKINVVTAVTDTVVRIEGDIKSPILESIPADTNLTLVESGSSWSKVSTNKGIVGYVSSKDISEEKTKKIPKNEIQEDFKHNIYNNKVCMAWHQVTNQNANKNIDGVLAKAEGINIICPTWFYINDAKGNLADLGSADYVKTCHNNNVLVWGLVSNLENPNINTTEILTKTSTRRALIKNIIAVANKYKLDGINIDFENLSSDAGDGFIQFIRELALELDDTKIVLSVDNYVPSDYTAFYDRAEQAKYADYIVLMAYDEHTSNSKEAGSTASLPWVKEGLENTLKEVPKKQVLLGIPLYTRVWKTVDGKVKSETIGIEAMTQKLNAANASVNWDKKLGQFYATYTDENDNFCEVWVEDTNSIAYKLELMRSNNIGGAAFWKVGLEPKDLWKDIIKNYSNPVNETKTSEVNQNDVTDENTEVTDNETEE